MSFYESLAGWSKSQGVDEVTRDASYDGVDPRFVETDAKDSQQNLSFGSFDDSRDS